MVGNRISHYRILEKLGEGGMGVVYKAEDLELKRFVALKFVHPELTEDTEARERFIEEAQRASALDHANICTIYEIGRTDDGQAFISMGYYEGETLAQKLKKGPLDFQQAIEIAIQVADGLATAHGAGIVHRDINPANVILTNQGEAKIIDFGLALLDGHSTDRSRKTLATLDYMSPEQIKGTKVDQRTDIWSLGVLLYEMLSGQAPFQGQYDQEIMYKIVQDAPKPIARGDTDFPSKVVPILEKALKKSPGGRYQDVVELSDSLRDILRPKRHLFDLKSASVSMVLLAVLAFVVTYFYLNGTNDSSSLRLLNHKKLTSTIGYEDFPSWSPDGGKIAYASNQSGNWDIWLQRLDGTGLFNLTSDHDSQYRSPSWSPDGRFVAFWSSREGGGFYYVPASGGTPTKIIAGGGRAESAPQWLNNEEIACLIGDLNEFNLSIVSLRDGSVTKYELLGHEGDRYHLSVSPNGRFAAYVSATSPLRSVAQVWVLRLEDQAYFSITDGQSDDRRPVWSVNSQMVYFVSDRGGTKDLWSQRLNQEGKPKGRPNQITNGIGIHRVAFSPNGNKLAYSKNRGIANIWSIPVFAHRAAEWTDATQVTFDEAVVQFIDLSPDGDRLLFSSDRSGNMDIWSMSLKSGDLQQLTKHPSPDWNPEWSPDGKEIVFYSARSGNRDIWLMSTEGDQLKQLTTNPQRDYFPSWVPDGKRIVYASVRNQTADIYVIATRGGRARQLTSHPGYDLNAHCSPDGKWIVFSSDRDPRGGHEKKYRLWRIPIAGGVPEMLTNGHGFWPTWSRDGKYIYYTRAGSNIWEVPAEGGNERQLTDLKDRAGYMRAQALATDGKKLFFAWHQNVGDIWLADIAAN